MKKSPKKRLFLPHLCILRAIHLHNSNIFSGKVLQEYRKVHTFAANPYSFMADYNYNNTHSKKRNANLPANLKGSA